MNLKPYRISDHHRISDHDTIHQICEHGLPDTIHTGDIEAFYPNTPHDLILDAFKHYHPLLRTERQLLRRLLNFNFATDGRHYYNFGNTGIPMGLPIAPELARMCTAYLLKDYNPPPGQSLTIYFDDIAASYPLDNIPLEPYTVKPTYANQTQDCRYDPQKKHFLPIQQQFRQPVMLNPMSYHPSANMAKNTYKSSAFRATKIGTNPADTLHYLLLKYLPALVRSGHKPMETIKTLVNISYFPQRSEKQEWEPKPCIKYNYSNTRPTKQQMQPLEIKEYNLIPNLPMAPLKAILCYQPPHEKPNHTYHLCGHPECRPCGKYEVIIENHLNPPVIPCTFLRCTYLLHTPNNNNEHHLYIDQCNLGNITIYEMVAEGAMERLLKNHNIRWQILTLHNATYKHPYRTIEPEIKKWKDKLQKKHPTATIHTHPHMQRFYSITQIT